MGVLGSVPNGANATGEKQGTLFIVSNYTKLDKGRVKNTHLS